MKILAVGLFLMVVTFSCACSSEGKSDEIGQHYKKPERFMRDFKSARFPKMYRSAGDDFKSEISLKDFVLTMSRVRTAAKEIDADLEFKPTKGGRGSSMFQNSNGDFVVAYDDSESVFIGNKEKSVNFSVKYHNGELCGLTVSRFGDEDDDFFEEYLTIHCSQEGSKGS